MQRIAFVHVSKAHHFAGPSCSTLKMQPGISIVLCVFAIVKAIRKNCRCKVISEAVNDIWSLAQVLENTYTYMHILQTNVFPSVPITNPGQHRMWLHTIWNLCKDCARTSDNMGIFVVIRAMQNCLSRLFSSAVLVQLSVLYCAVLSSLVGISSWFMELLNVAHLVLPCFKVPGPFNLFIIYL